MGLYIQIKGIDGESTENKHKNWIVAESAGFPVFRTIGQGAVDAQRTKGSTSLGDLTVSRPVDKSSPKIMETVALGKLAEKVTIDFTTTIMEKTETYLKWELENVIFTSYSINGSGLAEMTPNETFSMNFTKITYTYTPIDQDKGTPQGPVAVSYELGKNAV